MLAYVCDRCGAKWDGKRTDSPPVKPLVLGSTKLGDICRGCSAELIDEWMKQRKKP